MNVPNPFTYGNPITDPSRFFGRRRELELIFGRLQNPEFESSSIVGERRLGKTSLLYFASHPEVIRRFGLDPEVYLFIYLDLGIVGPDSTPTRFYKRMLRRIASRVEDPELNGQIVAISQQDPIDSYDLTDAIEATTRKGLYIVLLMDEFEAVCGNPNFGTEFYSGLRSLAIHNNLALITASRRDLVEISPLDEVRSSPFFNIFATFDLPSFTREEIDELLSQTLAGTGVSFSQEDIEHTIQLAGPHPHFLQMGFWSLFDSHQRHLDLAKRREDADSRFLRQAEPLLQTYWQISSQEEKIVLAVLALLEKSEREGEHRDLPKELEQWYGQANNILNLLVRRGLVQRTDNGHSLFSSAFSKWIVEGINGGRISFQTPEQLANKNQRLLSSLPGGISQRIEILLSSGSAVNIPEGKESNIKVVLVYHHELTRQGVLGILREHGDIEVVGDASTADEATGLLDLASSDVVLLDAELPQRDGIQIIHFLKERAFSGAVIFVSADVQIEELVNAIRRAPEGGFVFAGSVMATAKGQETALRYMAELQGGPGQPSPEKTDETPMESAESIPGAMVEDVDPSRVATLPTDSYTDADKIPKVEQAMGAQSENAIGASTDEEREANSSPVEAAAPLVGEIELVISGPFEPIKFLNLIQWLKDAGNAVIEEVMTSGQEQTVVRVTIRKSMPLLRMLAGIPDVAEVIEEPYTGSPDVFAESVQALGGKAKIGAGQTSLIRFRLKFRPST